MYVHLDHVQFAADKQRVAIVAHDHVDHRGVRKRQLEDAHGYTDAYKDASEFNALVATVLYVASRIVSLSGYYRIMPRCFVAIYIFHSAGVYILAHCFILGVSPYSVWPSVAIFVGGVSLALFGYFKKGKECPTGYMDRYKKFFEPLQDETHQGRTRSEHRLSGRARKGELSL